MNVSSTEDIGPNRVIVRFLSQYFDEKAESIGELESIVLDLLERRKTPILILFSAVYSGASWQSMKLATERLVSRSALASQQPDPVRPLVLVSLGNDVRMTSLARFKIRETTTELEDRKSIVPISRRTYFPNFMKSLDRPIYPFANVYRDFFQRYSGYGIFSLHRQSTSEPYRARHNAFHVDVEKMIRTTPFREALKTRLLSLKPPEYIICYGTLANLLLAEEIQTYFGRKSVVLTGVNEEELTARLPLKGEGGRLGDNVWIVEAVSITGTTLGVYAKWIRDNFVRQDITYFVGLNRPDSYLPTTFAALTNLLRTGDGRNRLEVVETVVLPNWGVRECPWCREQRMISNPYGKRNSALDSYFNQRLARLESSIRDKAFLVDQTFDMEYSRVFRFGRDSLFFEVNLCENPDEVSEADVVTAVASTAELWRAENRDYPYRAETATKGGSTKVSTASIIGPTAFTDPVIRAAVWRVFLDYELFPLRPGSLQKIITFLEAIIEKSGRSKHDNALSMEGILLLGDRARALSYDEGKLTDVEIELLRYVNRNKV